MALASRFSDMPVPFHTMISNVPGPPYALHLESPPGWCRWVSARCATIWACFIVSNSESMLSLSFCACAGALCRTRPFTNGVCRAHSRNCLLRPGARLKIAPFITVANTRSSMALRYQRALLGYILRDTVVIEGAEKRDAGSFIQQNPRRKRSPIPLQAGARAIGTSTVDRAAAVTSSG